MPSPAKQALQRFVEAEKLDTVAFANKFGYSYQGAWNLLRGKAEPGSLIVTRLIQRGYVKAARELAEALETEVAKA